MSVNCCVVHCLTKARNLLGSLCLWDKAQPLLTEKLNPHVLQVGCPVIQPAALNDNVPWHDIHRVVERGSAVGAEKMSVLLSSVTEGVVELGLA